VAAAGAQESPWLVGTVERSNNRDESADNVYMQVRAVQRTGIIGEVRLPETGQVSAQRKVAPIRDTYEDGSRRYEPLMNPAPNRQPQGFKFSGGFDLQKFFLFILLQQKRY
jgi:hypothetical protein